MKKFKFQKDLKNFKIFLNKLLKHIGWWVINIFLNLFLDRARDFYLLKKYPKDIFDKFAEKLEEFKAEKNE